MKAVFSKKRSLAALMCSGPGLAFAAPTGGDVVAGAATISTTSPLNTVINQSTHRAAINWQSFSIAGNEHVQFNQPNSNSISLNRVVGGNPSEILGNLSANGQVFLINPRGVYFGQNASLDVGGLVASTLDIGNTDFMNGNFKFLTASTNLPDGSSVVNDGILKAREGGYVVLAGDAVRNNGQVEAKFGTVALAAGGEVTLDIEGDGLVSFSVDGATTAEMAGVTNTGELLADGGRVVLTGNVANDLVSTAVNNEGLVQAKTITEKDGEIFLLGFGGDTVHADGAEINASDDTDTDAGFVEISSNEGLAIRGDVNVGRGGEFFIDPATLNIVAGAPGGSSVSASSIQTQLNAGTNVTLAASNSINFVGTGITATSGAGNLTLQPSDANVNINLNNQTIKINGDLSLNAGTATTISGLSSLAARNITLTANTITGSAATTNILATRNGGGALNIDTKLRTFVESRLNSNADVNLAASTLDLNASISAFTGTGALTLGTGGAQTINLNNKSIAMNGDLSINAGTGNITGIFDLSARNVDLTATRILGSNVSPRISAFNNGGGNLSINTEDFFLSRAGSIFLDLSAANTIDIDAPILVENTATGSANIEFRGTTVNVNRNIEAFASSMSGNADITFRGLVGGTTVNVGADVTANAGPMASGTVFFGGDGGEGAARPLTTVTDGGGLVTADQVTFNVSGNATVKTSANNIQLGVFNFSGSAATNATSITVDNTAFVGVGASAATVTEGQVGYDVDTLEVSAGKELTIVDTFIEDRLKNDNSVTFRAGDRINVVDAGVADPTVTGTGSASLTLGGLAGDPNANIDLNDGSIFVNGDLSLEAGSSTAPVTSMGNIFGIDDLVGKNVTIRGNTLVGEFNAGTYEIAATAGASGDLTITADDFSISAGFQDELRLFADNTININTPISFTGSSIASIRLAADTINIDRALTATATGFDAFVVFEKPGSVVNVRAPVAASANGGDRRIIFGGSGAEGSNASAISSVIGNGSELLTADDIQFNYTGTVNVRTNTSNINIGHADSQGLVAMAATSLTVDNRMHVGTGAAAASVSLLSSPYAIGTVDIQTGGDLNILDSDVDALLENVSTTSVTFRAGSAINLNDSAMGIPVVSVANGNGNADLTLGGISGDTATDINLNGASITTQGLLTIEAGSSTYAALVTAGSAAASNMGTISGVRSLTGQTSLTLTAAQIDGEATAQTIFLTALNDDLNITADGFDYTPSGSAGRALIQSTFTNNINAPITVTADEAKVQLFGLTVNVNEPLLADGGNIGASIEFFNANGTVNLNNTLTATAGGGATPARVAFGYFSNDSNNRFGRPIRNVTGAGLVTADEVMFNFTNSVNVRTNTPNIFLGTSNPGINGSNATAANSLVVDNTMHVGTGVSSALVTQLAPGTYDIDTVDISIGGDLNISDGLLNQQLINNNAITYRAGNEITLTASGNGAPLVSAGTGSASLLLGGINGDKSTNINLNGASLNLRGDLNLEAGSSAAVTAGSISMMGNVTDFISVNARNIDIVAKSITNDATAAFVSLRANRNGGGDLDILAESMSLSNTPTSLVLDLNATNEININAPISLSAEDVFLDVGANTVTINQSISLSALNTAEILFNELGMNVNINADVSASAAMGIGRVELGGSSEGGVAINSINAAATNPTALAATGLVTADSVRLNFTGDVNVRTDTAEVLLGDGIGGATTATSLTLDNAANTATTVQTASASLDITTVDIQSAGDLNFAGPILTHDTARFEAGAVLTLPSTTAASNGDLMLIAGSGIVAGDLSATGNLTASTTTGTLSFSSAAASNVSLTASTIMTSSTGIVVDAMAGSVLIDGAFSGTATTGTVTLQATNDIMADAVTVNAAGVALTAGTGEGATLSFDSVSAQTANLTGNAITTASAGTVVDATAGSITLDGAFSGTTTTGTVTLQATDDVTANTVTVNAAGVALIAGAGAGDTLSVDSVLADTISLTGNSITTTTAGTFANADVGTLTLTGGFSADETDVTLQAATGLTADGLSNAGTLTVTTTTGALQLNALATGSAVTLMGGSVSAGSVTSTSGNLNIDASGAITAGILSATTGDVRVGQTTAPTSLSFTTASGNNVSLKSSGTISTASNGTVINATSGSITLDGAFSGTATTGTVTLQATNDITADTVTVNAAGVALIAGTGAGDTLSVDSVLADMISLTGNSITTTTAGTFASADVGTLTLMGNFSAGETDVTLQAAIGLTADGLSNTGTLTVTSTTGALQLNALATGSAVNIMGGSVSAGNVTSTSGNLNIDASGAITAGILSATTGDVRVGQTTVPTSLSFSTASGNNVSLKSSGTISTASNGTVINATSGSITLDGAFSGTAETGTVTLQATDDITADTVTVNAAGVALIAGTGAGDTLSVDSVLADTISLIGNSITTTTAGTFANATNGDLILDGDFFSSLSNVILMASNDLMADNITNNTGGNINLDAGGTLTLLDFSAGTTTITADNIVAGDISTVVGNLNITASTDLTAGEVSANMNVIAEATTGTLSFDRALANNDITLMAPTITTTTAGQFLGANNATLEGDFVSDVASILLVTTNDLTLNGDVDINVVGGNGNVSFQSGNSITTQTVNLTSTNTGQIYYYGLNGANLPDITLNGDVTAIGGGNASFVGIGAFTPVNSVSGTGVISAGLRIDFDAEGSVDVVTNTPSLRFGSNCTGMCDPIGPLSLLRIDNTSFTGNTNFSTGTDNGVPPMDTVNVLDLSFGNGNVGISGIENLQLGTVTISAPGNLTLSGDVIAGTTTLTAGSLNAANLTATATDLDIDAGGAVTTGALSATTGDVRVGQTTAPTSLSFTTASGNNVSLKSSGTISTASNGTVINATSGSITLDGAFSGTAETGTVTLQATDDITADTVTVNVAGVALTAGTVEGDTLSVDSVLADMISLTGNSITTTTAGTFANADVGSLILMGGFSADETDVTLQAATGLMADGLSNTGTLTVTTTTGALQLNALATGSAVTLTGGSVSANNVTSTASDVDIDASGAITAGILSATTGDVRVGQTTAPTSLSFTTASGNNVSLKSSGTISTASDGTVINATSGSITLDGAFSGTAETGTVTLQATDDITANTVTVNVAGVSLTAGTDEGDTLSVDSVMADTISLTGNSITTTTAGTFANADMGDLTLAGNFSASVSSAQFDASMNITASDMTNTGNITINAGGSAILGNINSTAGDVTIDAMGSMTLAIDSAVGRNVSLTSPTITSNTGGFHVNAFAGDATIAGNIEITNAPGTIILEASNNLTFTTNSNISVTDNLGSAKLIFDAGNTITTNSVSLSATETGLMAGTQEAEVIYKGKDSSVNVILNGDVTATVATQGDAPDGTFAGGEIKFVGMGSGTEDRVALTNVTGTGLLTAGLVAFNVSGTVDVRTKTKRINLGITRHNNLSVNEFSVDNTAFNTEGARVQVLTGIGAGSLDNYTPRTYTVNNFNVDFGNNGRVRSHGGEQLILGNAMVTAANTLNLGGASMGADIVPYQINGTGAGTWNFTATSGDLNADVLNNPGGVINLNASGTIDITDAIASTVRFGNVIASTDLVLGDVTAESIVLMANSIFAGNLTSTVGVIDLEATTFVNTENLNAATDVSLKSGAGFNVQTGTIDGNKVIVNAGENATLGTVNAASFVDIDSGLSTVTGDISTTSTVDIMAGTSLTTGSIDASNVTLVSTGSSVDVGNIQSGADVMISAMSTIELASVTAAEGTGTVELLGETISHDTGAANPLINAGTLNLSGRMNAGVTLSTQVGTVNFNNSNIDNVAITETGDAIVNLFSGATFDQAAFQFGGNGIFNNPFAANNVNVSATGDLDFNSDLVATTINIDAGGGLTFDGRVESTGTGTLEGINLDAGTSLEAVDDIVSATFIDLSGGTSISTAGEVSAFDTVALMSNGDITSTFINTPLLGLELAGTSSSVSINSNFSGLVVIGSPGLLSINNSFNSGAATVNFDLDEGASLSGLKILFGGDGSVTGTAPITSDAINLLAIAGDLTFTNGFNVGDGAFVDEMGNPEVLGDPRVIEFLEANGISDGNGTVFPNAVFESAGTLTLEVGSQTQGNRYLFLKADTITLTGISSAPGLLVQFTPFTDSNSIGITQSGLSTSDTTYSNEDHFSHFTGTTTPVGVETHGGAIIVGDGMSIVDIDSKNIILLSDSTITGSETIATTGVVDVVGVAIMHDGPEEVIIEEGDTTTKSESTEKTEETSEEEEEEKKSEEEETETASDNSSTLEVQDGGVKTSTQCS